MFKIFNRPISSHITIYLPQISSLFSIWHRISGVLLISFFFFGLYSLKLSIWWLSFRLYGFAISNFIIYLIFFVCITSFFYHLLNGLRHIFWDFNLFLTNNLILVSGILITTFLLIFQVIIFKIFIY
uniref:succinate:cytochrome c oxidoreductase subunit 3 n=1 Tax=Batrachospermum sp. TaxID=31373 RepID=UPI001FA6F35F|nr:succinate:cytochrome c oxidoreductase subunit 3 [Batrachospermum sp.]UNB13406.1 succinate:cytochrome c oxidoreductase subunit 3 [Batrachospermum sp.]